MSSSAYNNTFKLLQQAGAAQNTKEDQLTILKGKPFWIWDQRHYYLEDIPPNANCCFNHIVGLPQKDSHDMPLLPYQHKIIDAILKHRRIVIIKSRGVGLSELLVRWYIYSAINRFPAYSNLLIIAGNREKIAIDLLNRCKRILTQKVAPDYFDNSNLTTAQIGTVTIEVMPARVQDIRGKHFVKSVWCDEADYFDPQQAQYEVRPAIEGLASKPNSNPEIIYSSTPRAPGSLMDTLMREDNNFYHKLTFPYTVGIHDDKGEPLPFPIYLEDELKQNRLSPNWRQEYECDFIGQAGNIVDPLAVDRAASLGKQLKTYSRIVTGVTTSIGIDPPGGGSGSAFARVVTQVHEINGGNQILVVKHMENHKNTVTWEFAVSRVVDIVDQIGYTPTIWVDAANQNFIQSLRVALNEPSDESLIDMTVANCRKYNIDISSRMNIIAVPFGTEGVPMTMRLKSLVEAGSLVINPDKFADLIIAIRSARGENFRYTKDSEAIFPDLFDAARLACCLYEYTPRVVDQQLQL